MFFFENLWVWRRIKVLVRRIPVRFGVDTVSKVHPACSSLRVVLFRKHQVSINLDQFRQGLQ